MFVHTDPHRLGQARLVGWLDNAWYRMDGWLDGSGCIGPKCKTTTIIVIVIWVSEQVQILFYMHTHRADFAILDKLPPFWAGNKHAVWQQVVFEVTIKAKWRFVSILERTSNTGKMFRKSLQLIESLNQSTKPWRTCLTFPFVQWRLHLVHIKIAIQSPEKCSGTFF